MNRVLHIILMEGSYKIIYWHSSGHQQYKVGGGSLPTAIVLNRCTGLMIIQSEANTWWLGTPNFDNNYKMMTWRYRAPKPSTEQEGGRCVVRKMTRNKVIKTC